LNQASWEGEVPGGPVKNVRVTGKVKSLLRMSIVIPERDESGRSRGYNGGVAPIQWSFWHGFGGMFRHALIFT
jgi:hypothetical protein